MWPLTRLFFVLFLAALAAASDEQPAAVAPVHVHHRMRVLGKDSPFTLKGTVVITPDGPEYSPAADFRDELTAWAARASDPNALYEVAIQTDGDASEWPRSSTRLCYVTSAKEELLTMHKTLSGDVFAVDYHLSSVPKHGACPSESSPLFLASTNILLKSPSPAFSPRLKTPPPLAPDGQPIKPVAEKSFIQKYWIYIVPALIMLLVLPAGPEEGAQQ